MHLADLMQTPPVVCETRRTISEVAARLAKRWEPIALGPVHEPQLAGTTP
jgi:hypothetical protein